MGKKHTIECVRARFAEEGYVLLSNVYVNSGAKVDFECPHKHRGQIRYEDFKQGYRCSKCAGTKKKIIEEVREFFEQQGYKLLSNEYVNSNTYLAYQCPKGHLGKISWGRFFSTGQRCAMCAGNSPQNIEYIRQQFEKDGYVLLSTTYVNVHSKLNYRCPKGHCRQITWSDFKQGYRCPTCRGRKKEKQLGEILEKIFPGKIRHLDNLDFLGRQSVDYSIRELRMAFEYDGKQHFEPVMFGSGKEQAELNFILQQERDERKNRLCKENNYSLIRISYREGLNLKNIKHKISLYKEEKK